MIIIIGVTTCQSRQTPSGKGILILIKFGRHITFSMKLLHTKFQIAISNSVEMARFQSFEFFDFFGKSRFRQMSITF